MARAGAVVVGRFGAAHGIRGEVRLKSFTQVPVDVAGYGTLTADDGRTFEIMSARSAAGSSSPDMLIVRVKGIDDRTAAEALTNLELSVPADRLPEAADEEFYHADLVGLAAETLSGESLGTVIAVQNYGAGDILEIAPKAGPTILVPFSRRAVPTVDIKGSRVVIDPPAGLFAGDDDAADEDAEGEGT
jgi:16S rRNA processing protein RimM